MLLLLCTAVSSASRDAPVRSWRNVLPPEMLKQLEADQVLNTKFVNEMSKFNKLSTNWLPLAGRHAQDKPKFATEAAIFRLKDLAFSEEEFEKLGVMGAEWWYQDRKPDEDIGFHYDKDESIASNKMRMVYPHTSTITYLSNVGAPTFILDMVTPNGNGNVPIIADVGYLSFPRANKHTVFDGKLMHGVHGKLNKLNPWTRSRENRKTLLINWWTQVPEPPNCIPLSPEKLARFVASTGHTVGSYGNQAPGLGSGVAGAGLNEDEDPDDLEADGASAAAATAATAAAAAAAAVKPGKQLVEVEIATVAVDDATSKYQVISLPPKERQLFRIPNELPMEKPDTIKFAWTPMQSLGGVNDLDLFKDHVASRIFSSKEPKLFVFYSTDRKRQEKVLLPAVRKYIVAGGKQQFMAFLADYEKGKDAWGAFGLTEKNAPHVAIHDTVGDRKFLMRGKFTPKRLEKFMAEYWEDKLTPMRGSGGDREEL